MGTSRRDPRALLLLVLAPTLGLALVLTSALTSGAASTGAGDAGTRSGRSGSSTDRPWSGFSIPATGRAAGAWIGARKVGRRPGQVVYRVDPRAAPRSVPLAGPRAVDRLGGGAGRSSATRVTTSRAAWILAKYGTYRDAAQSAAVDAAVLHLLAGGRFRTTGGAGAPRIAQTGYGQRVRDLAGAMLRDSRRLSGPYRVLSAQIGESEVGQAVQVALGAIVARSGTPVRALPVEVATTSGRWRAAGATDDAGRVTHGLTGLAAGPHQVAFRVGRVPETRLLVRQPRRTSASRVVVAGRKRSLTTSLRVVVLATPRVQVDGHRMARGQRTRGRIVLSGAYGRSVRPATVSLHGPFGAAEQTTCTRRQLRVRRVPVAGDGAVALPRLTLERAGAYTWSVAVPGDDYNRASSTCGGSFRVSRRSRAAE